VLQVQLVRQVKALLVKALLVKALLVKALLVKALQEQERVLVQGLEQLEQGQQEQVLELILHIHRQ
jgi:hypothetical protein